MTKSAPSATPKAVTARIVMRDHQQPASTARKLHELSLLLCAGACSVGSMQRARRNRGFLTLWLLALIACGISSRAPGTPGFVVLYVGDVLWGSLFFVLGAWLRPAATPLRVWLVMTALAELIEFSQLYQAPWAQMLRDTRLGGLLLGHAFLWSDVGCVVLGSSVAALADALCSARGQ